MRNYKKSWNFNFAIEQVLKLDVGHKKKQPKGVNGIYIPADTFYGVTENMARSCGYSGEFKDLTIEDVKNIYYQSCYNEQWATFGFDFTVSMLDFSCATEKKYAVRLLQNIIGVEKTGFYTVATHKATIEAIKNMDIDADFEKNAVKFVEIYNKARLMGIKKETESNNKKRVMAIMEIANGIPWKD